MQQLKYFSMFTGIGGFELGIHRAFNVQTRRRGQETSPGAPSEDGGGLHAVSEQRTSFTTDSDNEHADWGFNQGQSHCVGYSEIDKYAIQTFETNFGKEIKNYGDATKLNTAELPDFDLLVGGFPCQAFSIAGKRAGFEDARGTLIFDVVRVLRDKRPRYFILENVKGLLSHDGGKTFSHILEILTDTGYDVSWSIHNSKNYGVPQNRERIYLIGNLRGERRPQVFPNAGTNGKVIEQLNQPTHSNERVYGTGGLSPTLNTMQGGLRQPFVSGGLQKNAGLMHEQSTALTQAMGRGGGHTPILNAIRRLTPTECERLQGFPDNWTIGSDTQRYKQCGNAITVNVVEHIAKEILECQNS